MEKVGRYEHGQTVHLDCTGNVLSSYQLQGEWFYTIVVGNRMVRDVSERLLIGEEVLDGDRMS